MRSIAHIHPPITMAVAAVALLGASASAADFLILGKKLVVKDTGKRSKMVFKSKDDAIVVPDPAVGPDMVGASITLLNPVTGASGTLPLPAAGWKTNRSGTRYRYNDGLVKVKLRNRRLLNVKVKNTMISISDDSQGTLAVIFAIGPDRYCALFDPISVRRDQPCKFIAKNALAPVVCPSAGASPSGAFVAGSTLPSRTAEGLGQ